MADGEATWTDAELLAAHVNGDPEAFGELFRRHRDRMWAIALRTMGDPEEAADALQDALISAFRRAGSFRGEAAVTTWLHRIVVNACLDRIRRRAVRPTVPLVDQPLPDPTSEREVGLDVAAALARLPDEQRIALVLIDMQGYSVDEAAALLGVPTGTIKSRCARGRAKLLPYLAHLRPSSGSASSQSSSASASSSPASSPGVGNRRADDAVQPAASQTTRSWSEGGERAR